MAKKIIHTAEWRALFKTKKKHMPGPAAAGLATQELGYEKSILKSHRMK